MRLLFWFSSCGARSNSSSTAGDALNLMRDVRSQEVAIQEVNGQALTGRSSTL